MKNTICQNTVLLARNTNGGFTYKDIINMELNDFYLYLNNAILVINEERKLNNCK